MNEKQEYYFKEGCYIQEWQNTADHSDMSIARARVKPNTETRLHALTATTERYAIISGAGRVTVGDKSWTVSEGDVVVIEAGQAQKIANTKSQDLIFLAICSPRFEAYNYRDLQED